MYFIYFTNYFDTFPDAAAVHNNSVHNPYKQFICMY